MFRCRLIPLLAPLVLFGCTHGDLSDLGRWIRPAQDQQGQPRLQNFDEDASPAQLAYPDEDGPDSSDPVEARSTAHGDEFEDIWLRIADGFALPSKDNARIQREIDFYRRYPEFLTRTADNAEPFIHQVVEAIEARELPLEFALIPIIESRYRADAVSPYGATGLWQFMAPTGRHMGLQRNRWYDGRKDIIAATEAALDYLQYLHEFFDGDWELAMAAYNAGAGTIQKAQQRNQARGRATDYWSLQLPEETSRYVPRVYAIRALVEDPQGHGMNSRPISNQPVLQTVLVDRQLSLDKAAELLKLDEGDLQDLNPGLLKHATPPGKSFRLVVPQGYGDMLKLRLADLPEDQWFAPQTEPLRIARSNRESSNATSYRVKKGDTLSHIAARHQVSVRQLRQHNGLNSTQLKIGQRIEIPAGGGVQISSTDKHSAQQTTLRIKVQSGDSLWELAKAHDVSFRDLARWNNLKKPYRLMPGQTLLVKRESSPGHGGKLAYRVKSGDSLYLIARQFKVSVSDLQRWNRLQGDDLRPGQKLLVFL